MDERVYLFEAKDCAENIIIDVSDDNKQPQIHGASVPKLIQRLTYDKYPGTFTSFFT